MLFFLLSGFLMGHLYLKRPPAPGEIFGFAVKRLSRVYPLFALVVISAYLAIKLGFTGYAYGMSSGAELALTLGLVHGTSVLWTIGPEIIFYGVFMILWPLWHRSRLAFFGMLAPLMLLCWLPVEVQPLNSILSLHNRFPYFVLGMFMGLHSERFSARVPTSLFCIALAIYFFGSPQIASYVINVPERMTSDPWSFPVYIASSSMVMVTALLAKPRLLINPVMDYLGRVSYSFYLIHVLALLNIKPLLSGRPALAIAASLAVTITASAICHRWVETPAREAGRTCLRYIRGKRKHPVVVAS